MDTGGRGLGAVAGVAAAGTALAVAELVAIATGPRTSPLVAVGGVVVDTAPQPVVEFGIQVFGVWDRVALQIGTAILLAGAAAGLGAAAVRRWPVAPAGLGVFAAAGVLAAVTRPDNGLAAALPTVVGIIVAGVLYAAFRRRLVGYGQPPAPPVTPVGPEEGAAPGGSPDRRTLLRTAGLLVGGAVVVALGSRWLSTRRRVAAARSNVVLPSPEDRAPPVPSGADLQVPDLARYITGNDDFYRVDTALVVPQVDPAGWVLRVGGRVRRPFEISFQELLERPMVERYITLACVSNPVGGSLVGNARWLGVPIADLLAEAGPMPDADQVVGRSADGWTCGTPTAVLTDGRDALLAVGMNGEPLPPEHGFPVRMVVPGLYGYVSACKWIVQLELSRFDDFDAYWVPRGWAARGPVKTQSRIDVPGRSRIRSGDVTVAGVAWAPYVGIERVEVRADNGPWQEATLADTVSADTWRQWSWQWRATPGEHRLTVRATDASGRTQPQERSPTVPDGATGWHTVQVEVS